MKLKFKSPMAAVVAGAVVLVLAGGTSGAVANKLITGKDIAKNSVGTKHLKPGKINSNHIKDGVVRPKDLRPNLRKKINQAAAGTPATEGVLGVKHATLNAPKTVAKIGGPIDQNNTDLATGVTLDAGTYLVTVGGAFKYPAAPTSTVDVYPQLSLWIDKNKDGNFAHATEGSISPNAMIPNAVNRHIQVGDTTVITVAANGTYVGLLAHGYDVNGGSAGSGEIEVIDATITATPIN